MRVPTFKALPGVLPGSAGGGGGGGATGPPGEAVRPSRIPAKT
ncbi:hypothetical protein [Laspinema palackyanum]